MSLQVDYIKAGNPSSTHQELRSLAKSDNRIVRVRLAENPHTPADVLKTLADDHDPEVRSFVACNPSTAKAIVWRLASDEHDDVRFFMAGDCHLPLDVLFELSQDDNPYVQDCAQKTLEGVALEKDLEHDGFIGCAGTIARLGELLVASGLLSQHEVDNHAFIGRKLKIPLGRALVQAGVIDRQAICYTLRQQTLVRLGQQSVEEAIERIKGRFVRAVEKQEA